MDGELLPLERTPKILGVTFDPHFHFHKHVEAIEEKAKQRLSILKASLQSRVESTPTAPRGH